MKRFLIKLSYTVFPLWLMTIGLVMYLSLYVSPNATGDIGRLGLIPFGEEYERELNKGALHDTLFHTITSPDEIGRQSVDVLTIGDSFSQQGSYGYQNYISLKGLKVANCQRDLYNNPLQFAYNLMQMNLIDSTNVKVLVVEVVERYFELFSLSFSVKDVQIKKIAIKKDRHRIQNSNSSFWSIKRARDFVFYKFMYSPIYEADLNTELFTSRYPRKLFFYYEDIENGVSIDSINEDKVATAFKTIYQKADEQGITLILMIAVDMYDLYQGHIVRNRWPAKTINEDICRIIGKKQNVLLTKDCLLPLIEEGEKDVFLNNDTHWSYKASMTVAEELFNRIKHIGL